MMDCKFVQQDDIRSYIESSLKSGVHLSKFRKDRVGGDSHGVNFWYEDDSLIGHRLYREIRKAELGKVKTKGSKVLPNVTYHWETVATNLDEFQDVSEKLFSSNRRTEASLGKKLKNDMLLEIEKEHKRKEKLLKKQHRQALLLENFLDVDGYGAGRSLRNRKPVTYTFDDYDRSINEAIKITRIKPPSPEPSPHRREADRLEASGNGDWTTSSHPYDTVNDTTSVRSDFADYDDVNEERAESVDRSTRRRQRPQRYSTMNFVEAVSDNEVDFESEDDIVGETVYDEEYLKKRKQRKDLSSASEGDEEYQWEEDNANEEEEEEEEEEDSLSTSEEDSDEPQRFKKLPQRETKLRSRSNHLQTGLRRSTRATRVNYQQYEHSESENEATRPAKSRRFIEQDEPSDETEYDAFSMGSQESEEYANDPDTKVEEEEKPPEESDKAETHHTENDQLLYKPNGTEQEVEAVGRRRYLDLNELAPVSGFDDGPNTVLKDDDNNTDSS